IQAYLSSLFLGPYTITLTGGPVGPRYPVGSTFAPFDMTTRDPNRVTNPCGITLTDISKVPTPPTLPTRPPYPTFLPLEAMPPQPSYGGSTTGPDTTVPTVS